MDEYHKCDSSTESEKNTSWLPVLTHALQTQTFSELANRNLIPKMTQTLVRGIVCACVSSHLALDVSKSE